MNPQLPRCERNDLLKEYVSSYGALVSQNLSVYKCTYTFMATKTISITEEAYKALLNEKQNSESFTKTILRLTKKRGKLADSFGKWVMTEQEEQAIRKELSEGWRTVGERLAVEVP